MCRMVAFIGNIGEDELKKITNYMMMSSQDRIGTHEFHVKFEQGQFRHGDGWGLAWLNDRGLHFRKEVIPLWETNLFDTLRSDLLGAKALIIHARKASPGKEVILDSVHPFVSKVNDEEAMIVHNGTVPMDQLQWSDSYHPMSPDSDTERMFYNILTNYSSTGNMQKAIFDLFPKFGSDFSANLILLYGSKLVVTSNYSGKNTRPIYLGLKILRTNDYFIVASEEIDTFNGDWKTLSNGEFIEISLDEFCSQRHGAVKK